VIFVSTSQKLYQKPLEIREISKIPRNFCSFFFVFLRFLLILRTNAHEFARSNPKNTQKQAKNHNKRPVF